MKRSERPRRRTVRVVALSGAVLGLAGCATMPSNGPVVLGPSASGNTQNTRVELIPVPPADQELPDQLLYGFLDALGSDQPDYRTARLYLSGANWQPSGAVDVLDQTPSLHDQPGPDGKSYTVTATGTQVASLDTHGSYTAAADASQVSVDYHFQKNDKGQWRIVDPPQAVLTNLRDFQRIYESVNLYYPAASGQTGAVSPLVADPVYIRGRVDNPLQTAAQQLLNGPSAWLQPVVTSGFSANPNSKVELDTSSPQAKAYLSLGPNADWSPAACRTMAAQLYTTLTQGSSNIQATLPTSVALYRGRNGSPVCTSSPSEGAYNPVRVGATAYFLSADHHLRSVTPGTGTSAGVSDVPGKLVPAGTVIGSFAVSPAGDGQVASVSADGSALYVSNLRATTAPTTAVLRSGTANALSSPSWDATGTLWAVDAEPGGSPLRAVVGGVPVPVSVVGLPTGATIQQVRVAPDGARIALLLQNGGNTTVEIGRVRRTEGDDFSHKAASLTVEQLRQTASHITSISSLSWQDGDGLVVVGQQNGTPGSVVPVEMDGSPSSLGTIQGLSGVTDVTTLPGDPQQWLFATAKNPDNEIFVSQMTAFRWLPIADNTTSKGSGVRFPG